MIKHSFRAMALIFLMGACLLIGIFIGKSRLGGHIFVTFLPEASTYTSEDTPNRSEIGININTATASELTSLPGIGESISQRIVSYREENGPFSSIEDITDVEGIGQGKFQQIKDYITVGG